MKSAPAAYIRLNPNAPLSSAPPTNHSIRFEYDEPGPGGRHILKNGVDVIGPVAERVGFSATSKKSSWPHLGVLPILNAV
jgi:hypothetical protein